MLECKSEELTVQDIFHELKRSEEEIQDRFGHFEILVGCHEFDGQDEILMFEVESQMLIGVAVHEMLHYIIFLLL